MLNKNSIENKLSTIIDELQNQVGASGLINTAIATSSERINLPTGSGTYDILIPSSGNGLRISSISFVCSTPLDITFNSNTTPISETMNLEAYGENFTQPWCLESDRKFSITKSAGGTVKGKIIYWQSGAPAAGGTQLPPDIASESTLSGISTKLIKGQQTKANSHSLVLASDHEAIPVTVTNSVGGGGATQAQIKEAIETATNLDQLEPTLSQITNFIPLRGTQINGVVMPTGGEGTFGWLSAIWKELKDQKLISFSSGINAADVSSVETVGANSQKIITGNVALNSSVRIDGSDRTVCGIQISGAWVGTLQFEKSINGGSTWSPLLCVNDSGFNSTTTTQNCIVFGNYSSGTNFRVRATAFTSGTANITLVLANGISSISSTSSGGTNNGATETTLVQVRDRLPVTGAATEASVNHTAVVTGFKNDPPTSDPASTTATLISLLKGIFQSVIGVSNKLPSSLGAKTAANSFPVTLAPDGSLVSAIGTTSDAAAASDTANATHISFWKYFLTRLTTLINLFPTSLSNGRFRVDSVTTTIFNITDPILTEGGTHSLRSDNKGNLLVTLRDSNITTSGTLFVDQEVGKNLIVKQLAGDDSGAVSNAFAATLTTTTWTNAGTYRDYRNYTHILLIPQVTAASDAAITADIRFKWSGDGTDNTFSFDFTEIDDQTTTDNFFLKRPIINIWRIISNSAGVKSDTPIILPRINRYLQPQVRLSGTSTASCTIQFIAIGLVR